jgi:hypothetical protein
MEEAENRDFHGVEYSVVAGYGDVTRCLVPARCRSTLGVGHLFDRSSIGAARHCLCHAYVTVVWVVALCRLRVREFRGRGGREDMDLEVEGSRGAGGVKRGS